MATRRQVRKTDSHADSQTSKEVSTPNNILYDLNIFTEWSQEAENVNRTVREKSASGFAGKLYSAAHRSVWTFLRSIGIPQSSSSPCNLPVNLIKLVNIQHSWSICLSQDGEFLAVLQESSIEIRSRRDNYSTAVGKTKLLEDANPQWRRMAWSSDGDMIAVSYSTGAVVVLDIMCGEFFTLNRPEVAGSAADLSTAVAAMIFTKPKKGTDPKWDVKLMIINHQGLLTSYLISTDECEHAFEHNYLFSNTYPRGISSVIYSEQHSLLIISGLASPSTELWQTQAGKEGITAWRVLSGSPYYKMVTDYEQDAMGGTSQGFLRKFKSAIHGAIYGDGMQELVYKSCLSPDGKHLLTLSTESKLCLYQVPSLTLIQSWSLDKQPCSDQLSPSIEEHPRKSKYLRDTPFYYHLLDVEWWSDKEVILARYSGAVLVADIENLSNLLGESPEWFEICPQVQQAHDGGFLSLECETRVLTGNRKRTLSENAATGGGDDSDSDDESTGSKRSLVKQTKTVLRDSLYYITDMDRFEPPKKKSKFVKKTYKLVSLKSTTPEELFARKIDHEEYGEALVLAKLYHLDADLVYQRQWRKSDVTLATIHDYLSKIRKRAWVLHECIERVPNNIDAMRELLQYGLRGTDLEALVKIGQGKDKGRFIVGKEITLEESFDELDDESVEELEQIRKKHREDLLTQISWESLTLEQRELCKVRVRLLTYLDRLATYEEILGGGRFAEQHFDGSFFRRFRAQNVVEAIADYARVGDWKAVDTMFVNLGDQTLPHRLAILSNLPETLPPSEYACMLPVVDMSSADVLEYQEMSLREPDWCENPLYRKYFDTSNHNVGDFLYDENDSLKPFQDESLTPDLLTKWYAARACDIECRSRLVDHALDFVELGMKNNVQGLDSLRDDLSVMEMIVYDCNYGDSLTFSSLQGMDDLERLKVIMSKSTADKYASHIQKWMRPFLEKCEAKKGGSFQTMITDYLKLMAVSDLQLVFKVFECSKVDQPPDSRILRTEELLLSSAIDCIYSCERDDQLSFVLSILECLPHRKPGDMQRSLIKLHNEVDELEHLIGAAEILESYGVNMKISSIRDSQNDANAATMLMKKLTRRANNRTPSLSTSEWTQLQSDMAALQSKVYRCIDKYTCCEIFVESLLCSGKVESIQLSLSYMEADNMESSTQSMSSSVGSLGDSQIPYQEAIDIVIRASREYFNASGSHDDQNMRLAECCLHLFPKTDENIREELELISALPLLQDFNIFILPLKVRLCEKRLNLIEEALRSSKTAYKQYPKFLKLAEGLRVEENAVLRLIIQQALSQSDTKFAYKHCKNVMEREYPAVWSECYQLACLDGFTDTDARMALLSYSLVHCSDEMIEEILRKRMSLKNEILVNRMGKTVSKQPRESSPPISKSDAKPEEGVSKMPDWQTLFSAKGAVGALSKTTQHTKSLLSNLGDMNMKLIDRTVSLISGRHDDADSTEAAFTQQGCHPFYEDAINKCQPSIELYGSKRLEMSFAEDILRTTKLKETLSGGQDMEDCSQVLVNCAAQTLPTDLTLGLGFLLSIPKPCEADGCFRELPHVPLTLRLGSYYYALQLLTALSLPHHGTVSEVIGRAQGLKKSQLKEEIHKELYEKLDLYVRLMEDHSQACYLQSLGKDVDCHRFTADNDYKKQTILSLARSMDQVRYDTAIDMASRYSVSMWEVYVTHLQYLMVDSGLTTSQIDKRINKLNVVDALVARDVEFPEYMDTNVRPHIDGTDMNKLLLYYRLIEPCTTLTSETVSPETHRKLLTKLMSSAPGLDYGALLSAQSDPVDIIRPVLKSGNVQVFSKLSSKIPVIGGGTLSSSAVYNAWAQKLFIDGPSANSKVPESTAAWVHRYESCSEFLHKMEADDNVSFIKHALFSDKSLDMVPLDARQEICRRNVKHCKQNTCKDKQTDGQSERMTWTEALDVVMSYQTHLDQMSSESLIGLRLAEDVHIQSYHKKIDSCMGDAGKLKLVLVDMLLDGQALELVNDILQVIPVVDWTVRNALSDAVSNICQHFRDKQTRLGSNDKPVMESFENLIAQVGEHQKEEGDLVSSEDVMSLFRPLIPDTSIELSTRLQALTLLEQNFSLGEEDKLMVRAYQTQAVTATHWPHRQIEGIDMKTEDGQVKLFLELLDSSDRLEQFLTLPSLLNVWPKVKDPSSLWIQLIDRMLSPDVSSTQSAENVVALCLTERLNQGVVQKAYSSLVSGDYLHQAAMLALHSESPVLQDDVVSLVADNTEKFCEDDSILKAIFERHLMVDFVESEMFQPLVDYLVKHQKQADFLEPNIIINELQQANLNAEAKKIEKACRGQHGTLEAAAGAMSALSRWWKKN